MPDSEHCWGPLEDGSTNKVSHILQPDADKQKPKAENNDSRKASWTGKISIRKKNLSKIRDFIAMSRRKKKKIPKPSQPMKESVIDNEQSNDDSKKKTDNEPIETDAQSKSNVNLKQDKESSLAPDYTQEDSAKADEADGTNGEHVNKQRPEQIDVNIKGSAEGPMPENALPVLNAPMKYDTKILEFKVKQRIRRYAIISFCLALFVFSMTFILFIIAVFGWYVSLSTHKLIGFEHRIKYVNNWTDKEITFLPSPLLSWNHMECPIQKVSKLPWSSWTECLKSDKKAIQWRWRNISSGLYFLDEQLFNIKWCTMTV